MERHRFRRERVIPKLSVLVLVVAAGFVGLYSGCSGDAPTDVEVVTPKIMSLSETVLSTGDTLVITGTDFATPATGNVVVFNNALASVAPFSAAGETLAVVVPANANSGPLYVKSKGVQSNSVVVEVERGVGDVWVVGGVPAYEFKVPIVTGSDEYLIVAESATSTGQSFVFQVTPDTSSVYPAPARFPSSGGTGTVDLGLSFETAAREEAIEYLRTHGMGRPGVIPRAPAGPPAATRQFFVVKPLPECCALTPRPANCRQCSYIDPANFTTVTATLVYETDHALIYADVDQPEGSFEPADYEALALQFEIQIYPTNTTAFGLPTPIDGNNKIVILFTPRVNLLTAPGTAVSGFISGFVLVNDFAPGIFPQGTSNGINVFYSMVPDPSGEYGNFFPKAWLESENVVPGTLAHEFEHMISIGYRYLVLGGGTNPAYIQQTWLEEGMAHMAEDLNNMDSQNIRRADLYLAEPFGHSLFGNAEADPKDTLEQRGGIFLFLRYLGDRYGEKIFKTIVQYRAVGIASIENVTKTSFHSSVGDYLAALYLSDRGITSDTRYRFTSFNIQNDFGDLLVTDRIVQQGAINETVRSAAGNFFRVTGAEPPAINIRVSTPSSSARVRLVVVKTQ